MNGSGKSTILEIIFRILNNVAVSECAKMPHLIGTDMEYAYGVYADLYCECGDYINLIRCRNEKTVCYRYQRESRTFPLIEEGGMPNSPHELVPRKVNGQERDCCTNSSPVTIV